MVMAPVTLAAVLMPTVPEPEKVRPPVPVICAEIVGLVPLSQITPSLAPNAKRAAGDRAAGGENEAGGVGAVADGQRVGAERDVLPSVLSA